MCPHPARGCGDVAARSSALTHTNSEVNVRTRTCSMLRWSRNDILHWRAQHILYWRCIHQLLQRLETEQQPDRTTALQWRTTPTTTQRVLHAMNIRDARLSHASIVESNLLVRLLFKKHSASIAYVATSEQQVGQRGSLLSRGPVAQPAFKVWRAAQKLLPLQVHAVLAGFGSVQGIPRMVEMPSSCIIAM